jgi:hypothetical protein
MTGRYSTFDFHDELIGPAAGAVKVDVGSRIVAKSWEMVAAAEDGGVAYLKVVSA